MDLLHSNQCLRRHLIESTARGIKLPPRFVKVIFRPMVHGRWLIGIVEAQSEW